MTMFKYAALVLLPVNVASLASAQAIPAYKNAGTLQLGASFVFCYPDYTPQKALGFGIYADYDFAPHLGASFVYRRVSVDQHPDRESSYLIGMRYHRIYGKFEPFGNVLVGRGVYYFGPLDHSAANEGFNAAQGGNTSGYNVVGFAGGVDVRLQSRFSLRAEAEYQDWLAGPNLDNGLTPILYTAGLSYRFERDHP